MAVARIVRDVGMKEGFNMVLDKIVTQYYNVERAACRQELSHFKGQVYRPNDGIGQAGQ